MTEIGENGKLKYPESRTRGIEVVNARKKAKMMERLYDEAIIEDQKRDAAKKKAKEEQDKNPNYKWHPERFATDILCVEPTEQQTELLTVYGRLLRARERKRQGKATEKDREWLEKYGISVMAARGVGKDAAASWILLHFLMFFENSTIVATAPTADQLSKILWAEVIKWANRKNAAGEFVFKFRHLFEFQSEKIFIKHGGADAGKKWFAYWRTVNVKDSPENQAETLSGVHEDNLLFIIDEASGIPDPVFRPIEGTLTGVNNLCLMIFNPTRSGGYAYDSHYSRTRSYWVPLQWSAIGSGIVELEQIERLKRTYGEESNQYRISVLGLPPSADPDAFNPRDWVIECVNKDVGDVSQDPLFFGIDCGAGGDDSVIVKRRGSKLEQILIKSTPDTMELVGWVAQHIEDDAPDDITIDNIGIGQGVYNRLRELGYRVTAGDVRRKCNDGTHRNMRTKLWAKFRNVLENRCVSIPDNADLIEELTAPKVKIISSGGFEIEPKSDMKQRLKKNRSPNMADALMLTYYNDDRVIMRKKQKNDKYFKNKKRESKSFMAA